MRLTATRAVSGWSSVKSQREKPRRLRGKLEAMGGRTTGVLASTRSRF